MGLRDQILTSVDNELHAVNCPEWGCTVYVKVMGLDDRWEVMRAAKGKGGKVNFVLVVKSCVEADGTPVFSMDDLPLLQQKAGSAIERIVLKSIEVNRIGGDEVEDAKKNSKMSQNESSPTDSPPSGDVPSES